jgi:hypothetical protein
MALPKSLRDEINARGPIVRCLLQLRMTADAAGGCGVEAKYGSGRSRLTLDPSSGLEHRAQRALDWWEACLRQLRQLQKYGVDMVSEEEFARSILLRQLESKTTLPDLIRHGIERVLADNPGDDE